MHRRPENRTARGAGVCRALATAIALAALVGPAAPRLALAQSQLIEIDTRGPGVGPAAVALGLGSGRALGQTFVAPTTPTGTAPALVDFTFFVIGPFPTASLNPYQARVQAFAAGDTTGPVLYASDLRVGPEGPTNVAPPPQTYSIPPLVLRPGATYVAYLDLFGPALGGFYHVAAPGPIGSALDTYAGGGIYQRGGAPSTHPADLAFVAHFTTVADVSTVPEPGTAALVAGGLLGLWLVRARRRLS